jgi:hypothetical protein
MFFEQAQKIASLQSAPRQHCVIALGCAGKRRQSAKKAGGWTATAANRRVKVGDHLIGLPG